MAISKQLNLGDIRAAFRLVGECRDLRGDPAAWRCRAFEGMSRLVGAISGNGGEIRWPDRRAEIEMVQSIAVGFSQAQLGLYGEFMREYGPNNPLPRVSLQKMTGRVATQSRSKLFDLRAWNRADFQGLFLECGIGHNLISLSEQADRISIDTIILHRARGELDFSARDRNLLHLFHDELGRLIGPVLASAGESERLLKLSPRLRQTLDCLLEGDSEKQVARRLGLKQPTVHQYVTELYRRFGVSSRAELLARLNL